MPLHHLIILLPLRLDVYLSNLFVVRALLATLHLHHLAGLSLRLHLLAALNHLRYPLALARSLGLLLALLHEPVVNALSFFQNFLTI